jgi:hypothetical protein
MTFGELLFWIIVAIIAFFLLKVGIVILIIVIILIVLYYIFGGNTSPNNPPVYTPYYEGYRSTFPVIYANPHLQNPETVQYVTFQLPEQQELNEQTGHGDYWYMPVQDYYDEKQNAYIPPESCLVPNSTSEYCVNKQLQQTGNMDVAISRCQVPAKTSASCAC